MKRLFSLVVVLFSFSGANCAIAERDSCYCCHTTVFEKISDNNNAVATVECLDKNGVMDGDDFSPAFLLLLNLGFFKILSSCCHNLICSTCFLKNIKVERCPVCDRCPLGGCMLIDDAKLLQFRCHLYMNMMSCSLKTLKFSLNEGYFTVLEQQAILNKLMVLILSLSRDGKSKDDIVREVGLAIPAIVTAVVESR
jgi:hypothetical protein